MKKPIEYIKEAWGIYTKKDNFLFFARIMAVVVITSTLIGFLISYFYYPDFLQKGDFSDIPKTIGLVVLGILSVVAGLWSQTTTYVSILKMGGDEKETLKLGFSKISKFFLISFVVVLIILCGLILLVLPAIIFGIWYSFSTFLVLDKGIGIKKALQTSKLMVKGKFWKVFGIFFVFGLFTFLVSLLISAVPYIGPLLLSFVAPLFTLPFYLLYKDLMVSSD